MIKVLVIEDEPKISRFIQLELEHEGYTVELSGDGRDGYEKAKNDAYDVIILDIMIPYLSGMEVCRRLRQDGINTPIIMLTAKDDITDKVMGLDIGADDYMTKPFAIEELLARIRVVLKRKAKDEVDSHKLIVGDLVLDKEQYSVSYKNDLIELTKKEFELLQFLMENKNIVLSRDKIIDKVWGYDYIGETNITDVYIRYLRSKIDQKYDIDLIKTIRGVGYQLKDD